MSLLATVRRAMMGVSIKSCNALLFSFLKILLFNEDAHLHRGQLLYRFLLNSILFNPNFQLKLYFKHNIITMSKTVKIST
jgi:hypothetical protein